MANVSSEVQNKYTLANLTEIELKTILSSLVDYSPTTSDEVCTVNELIGLILSSIDKVSG